MPSAIQTNHGSSLPAMGTVRQGVLSVLVGAPALAAEIPEGPPCFILDADPESLRSLQSQLRHRSSQSLHIWRTAVLTADAQPVVWHRFNDCRLDGPWDEAHQRRRFPNASCRSKETLATTRLDTLLDDWELLTGVAETVSFSIVMRQGDPLGILRGSGRWLRRFEQVDCLVPFGEDLSDREELNNWLRERCFDPDPDLPFRWLRDRGRTMELRLVQALHARAALEERLSESAVRLLLAKELEDKQIQQQRNLTLQLQELNRCHASLQEELNHLRLENDNLRCQLEALSTRNLEADSR